MFNTPKYVTDFGPSILDSLVKMTELSKKTGVFPPYNIIKLHDGSYLLEMALAGFDIADINIEVTSNKLTIGSAGKNPNAEFLNRGFTYKAFERVFDMMIGVKVERAEMENGVLRVYLSVEQDSDKPKKINIKSPSAKNHPQVLNEDSVI